MRPIFYVAIAASMVFAGAIGLGFGEVESGIRRMTPKLSIIIRRSARSLSP